MKKAIRFIIVVALFVCLLLVWGVLADPDHWTELPSLIGTENLERAVSQAILEHNSQINPGDFLRCESHEIFSVRSRRAAGKQFTVYLTYAYEEYTWEQGKLSPGYACICPAALTFKTMEDGSYQLLRYREPRDGVNFSRDLEDNFPDIPADTIYGLELKSRLLRECREKARYTP